jgi:hypothetical protein
LRLQLAKYFIQLLYSPKTWFSVQYKLLKACGLFSSSGVSTLPQFRWITPHHIYLSSSDHHDTTLLLSSHFHRLLVVLVSCHAFFHTCTLYVFLLLNAGERPSLSQSQHNYYVHHRTCLNERRWWMLYCCVDIKCSQRIKHEVEYSCSSNSK